MKRLMVDANILLYLANSLYPEHPLAFRALDSAIKSDYRLVVSAQIIRETLVVASGKLQARRESTLEEIVSGLKLLIASFDVVGDAAESLQPLLELILAKGVRGKRIHDANIVATMRENSIHTILTNNPTDFAPFADLIRVVPLDGAAEALA